MKKLNKIPVPCWKSNPLVLLGKFLLLLVFSSFLLPTNAQRPPRVDLHSLSTTQQQALANLIDQWLDQNPGIVQDHVINFSTGIHNTSNFMPWHRIHIRMLEDFIREQTGNHDFLLPKWQPEINPGGGLPKIPVPFQVTASGAPVGNMNFNPTPTTSMNNFTNNLANCHSSLTDAGAFSDIEEVQYHNAGHGIVGGIMQQANSPDALIFWPWHAWVDEHWYQWERDCPGEFDIHDVNGDNVVDITSNQTWSGEMYVKGRVIVHSGVTLTIAPGAVVRFLSSDYNAFETSITVMPGGRLTIDGGTLTGMDVFGNGGIDGERGIKYHTGWNGITVLGDGGASVPAQGRVWVKNGGKIEHALVGIHSKGGGRILAQGGNFYNNRISVKIDPHPHNNFTMFTGCSFINDKALRDVVWQSSPIAGNIVEHHINHHTIHSTEAHMYLDNCTVFSISGCTFDIPFQDPHIYYGGRRGIQAFDSRISVTNSYFYNHKAAIEAKNSLPGPGRNVTVNNSHFVNNIESIYLMGVDYSSIRNCTFQVPATPAPWPGSVACGVGSDGSAALTIKDNVFSTFGGGLSNDNYGLVIGNSGNNFASLAQRNSFTGINIGTQLQKVNTMLQVKCHDFNQYQRGMAVTSGQLANQGSCTNNNSPAGSTWDDLMACFGSDRQIFKDASVPPFVYSAHANQIPTCVSPGVIVDPCQSQGNEQSCADPQDPCGCVPWPCCELEAIAQLETIRQGLVGGGGSEGEIWNIVYRQKRKFHEGLKGIFESEEEGQTTPPLEAALEFVDDVAATASIYPADKASLLLLKAQQGSIDPQTAGVIASLSSEDAHKFLLSLKLGLLQTQRSYAQMDAAEKQAVAALAAQPTKAGAHARVILEMAYGQPATFEVERIEEVEERSSDAPDSPTTLELPSAPLLECYPNPAESVLNVRFKLDDPGRVSLITLTDLNGRRVAAQTTAGNAGVNTFGMDISGLPSGLYFLRLETDGKFVAARKVVVKR